MGRVVPGSPAARGRNVWLGDLLESVDERAVPIGPGSVEAARLLIEASGDVVTLGIRRPVEGDELEKVAVLALSYLQYSLLPTTYYTHYFLTTN